MKDINPAKMESQTNGKYIQTAGSIWLPQGTVVRNAFKKRKRSGHKTKKKADRQPTKRPSIDNLNLPTRISRSLKKHGVKEIADLAGKDKSFFTNIKGFGDKSYKLLVNTMKTYDIHTKDKNLTHQDVFDIELPYTLKGSDPVEVLGLPIRLENALKLKANITSVEKFCEVTDNELIKTKNIGPKYQTFLLQVKKKIEMEFGVLKNDNGLDKEKKLKPKLVPVPQNMLVSTLMSRCSDEREKSIISRRYGLSDGDRQTLEEVGEFYDLTRERIRQIQVKALKKMRRPIASVREPLTKLIDDICYEYGGLLTAEDADREIPKAVESKSIDGSALLDLLCDLGWIQSCKIGDISVYCPLLNGVDLSKLSERVTLLIKREDLGLDAPSIVQKTNSLARIKNNRFKKHKFIIRYCSIDPRIETIKLSPENIMVFRYYTSGNFATKGWISLMVRVLEEEQMPLHFTEIAHKVNDLLANTDRHLDVRRAHSIMIESKQFAHSGINGTYGLTVWGLRKESTPRLIKECLDKAGFPLHWKQIYQYVSKYKDSKQGSIITVLNTNKSFTKTGNGTYWHNKN